MIQLLTCCVCFVYVLLMLSYVIAWKRTKSWLNSSIILEGTPLEQSHQPSTLVSIILPVRDEEKNVLSILQSLSKQSYAKENFEIIVVDDFSNDNTSELVSQSTVQNLKFIRLLHGQGKKKAIEEGIAQAKGTLIITTDADCEVGEKWLSTIVAFYEVFKPKMIVAPVLVKNEKGFQQIIQSQEMTVLTASAGASLFYNSPILCSGANLAYEKEAFLSVKGFEGVDATATGDDVFLMQKIHRKFPGEIKYLKSKEAIVFTHPEKTTSGALGQRKRWASKSFSYGFSPITAIAILVFLANFLILISGILSVINIKFALIFVITFSAKLIVDFMLLYSSSSFFGKRMCPVLFFFSSLLYLLYVSIIGLVSPFTTYTWKGRPS
ncbi:MAG: glycosyltransferase [Bacteroidetes bacterium]|nr:glycosyltransferase [Bacteroidota bacterium]